MPASHTALRSLSRVPRGANFFFQRDALLTFFSSRGILYVVFSGLFLEGSNYINTNPNRSEPKVYRSLRQREDTHIPPAFQLSPFPVYTHFVRRGGGEAACAAWGQLVLRWCFRSPNPLLSLPMIAAAAPRQLTPIPTPTS